MPPPAPPSGPLPPPPGARPEPPRASWWSVGAVFATMVLASAVFVSLQPSRDADGVALAVAAVLAGLAVGALLANTTPVGRLFRRWSAIVAAMLALLGSMVLLAALGGIGGPTGALVLLGVVSVIAGLDLCYVSRLRVMVVLSGLGMIPVLAALGPSALFSAFAWFTAAMFSLWLLSADEQRSVPRPEPVAGPSIAPRARSADLVRTVAMALLGGFTLAFLMSTPSCSLSPLASALEWLPWHPRIDPGWSPNLDQPVRLPELDEHGHETVTYLDREGRRFLVDPTTGEPFGVIDRDGSTVVVDLDGREAARFTDGGLDVTDPAGGTIRYERDDDGWYTDTADGTRHRVRPSGPLVVLEDEDGRPVARSIPGGSGTVEVRPDAAGAPGVAELDRDGDGRIPVPNDAILDATTGRYRDRYVIEHDGGTTSIEVADGERRTYRETDEGVDVDVDPRWAPGTEHRYHLDPEDDSVTVYDRDGEQVLTLDVDREGNALDSLEEGGGSDPRDRQPDSDRGDLPSPPWRAIAIVVAVLAALGAGIAWWVWWRRRQGPDEDDRGWAEAQVRRLEAWGRDHTFPREPNETVVRYAARLDHEIARDGALPEVGDVLDDALFGRRPLPMDARLRAEATIARLVEEHPKPGRAERLRGGVDHDLDRDPDREPVDSSPR